MGNQKSDTSPAKSSKKGVIIVSIIALVIIIALGGVIWYLLTRDTEQPAKTSGSAGVGRVVTDDNVDEILNDMNNQDDASYTSEQNSNWEFASGNDVSENAFVRNNERNKHPVYFTVNLRNDDSSQGDLIYTSPTLNVGEKVDQIKLQKALPKGDYPAILEYHILDETNNNEEKTSVMTGIILHIQN